MNVMAIAILKILSDSGKAMSIKSLNVEMKKTLGDEVGNDAKTKSSLYTMLSRMKKQGWITSSLSKTIPPIAMIGLTSEGLAILEPYLALFSHNIRQSPHLSRSVRKISHSSEETLDSDQLDAIVFILVDDVLCRDLESITAKEKAKLYSIAKKICGAIMD